jgi:hypothetical protein
MHACEVYAYEMQMTPIQIDAPQCLKYEGVLALGGVGKGVVPSQIRSPCFKKLPALKFSRANLLVENTS